MTPPAPPAPVAPAPTPAPRPAPPTTPVAATPAPGATQPPPRPIFIAKPCSALVVGTALGLAQLGPGRTCSCTISAAFPGRTHRPFECPIRYHQIRGQCPGWTAAGARIPSCWVGDDLTPACRDEWRDFATTLENARAAHGAQVSF